MAVTTLPAIEILYLCCIEISTEDKAIMPLQVRLNALAKKGVTVQYPVPEDN
jgi:hypothetical protein